MRTRSKLNEQVKAALPIARRTRSHLPKPNPIPSKKRDILALYKAGYFDGRGDTSRNVSGNKYVRHRLIEEQGYKCAGLVYSDEYHPCKNYPTECDHMIELRHGGTDSVENLQMICNGCHVEKTRMNYRGQIGT